MDTLRELLEYTDKPLNVPILEAVDKAIKSLHLQKPGGKVNTSSLKGASSFFKANSKLVAGSAALAIQAYDQYSKHRRGTLRLHAKSPYERKMITSIVDALTDKGYKVRRIRFEHGGRTWELFKT